MFCRRDTRKVRVKNFAEVFPSKFLDSQVFTQARETAAVIPPDVPVSFTCPFFHSNYHIL